MAAPGMMSPAVRVLDGPQETRKVLASMLHSTKYEALSVLPDAPLDVRMLRSSWDIDVELLDRGIDVRVIYPAQAARTPDVMEYLSQFAARGARVRVLGHVPNRMVISDRARAVALETPDLPNGRVLLVSGKVLVRALYTEFIGLWRASLPVGFSSGGLDVDLVRGTLHALSSGLTDEAVAKKNGWSLRTYRRRIAAVMELLGTTSRFEAGALAREQGWI